MAWICTRCETLNPSGSECEVCGHSHESTSPIRKDTHASIPTESKGRPHKEVSALETKSLRASAKSPAEPKLPASLSIWQWRGLTLVLILVLLVWRTTHNPSSEIRVQIPSRPQIPRETYAPIPRVRIRENSAQKAEQAEQAEIQAQRARRIKQEVIDEILDVRKKAQNGLLTQKEIENQQVKLRQSLTLALNCAEKALRLNASNRTAWQQKTAALYLMGHYGDALQSARQGLQNYPQDVDLLDAKTKIQAKMRQASPRSSQT